MPTILKMKDISDDFTVDKGLLPNLPFRGLCIGKTGTGKTSFLGNFLRRDDYYLNNFKGDDVYIFSPLKNDFKMETIIKVKDIPEGNITSNFDDEILGFVYDKMVEEFEDDITHGRFPPHKLIILDDLSFSGKLRGSNFNNISRVFCNGRKQNISIIITSQFYTHILPVCRENASFIVLYNTSHKQLESCAEENNYLPNKKMFIDMFRANVTERNDFLMINHSNKYENLYLNKDFEPLQPDI